MIILSTYFFENPFKVNAYSNTEISYRKLLNSVDGLSVLFISYVVIDFCIYKNYNRYYSFENEI